MAITLVQHAQNNGSLVTSVTVTLGSNTTAGNCLVVCVATNNTTTTISGITLGGSAGNFSQIVSQASPAVFGSGASCFIWADPNCAGGQTSVVVTFSASVKAAVDVYEFSGLVASSVLDKSSTASGTSTSWTSGTTATTALAAEAWVGVVAIDDNTGTPTGPFSSWTNETAQGLGGATATLQEISGYQITSSTGTATYSGSYAAAADYAGAVVTLKGAGLTLSLPAAQETIAAPAPGVSAGVGLATARQAIQAYPPSLRKLIVSLAAAAGTDDFGNAFPQGLFATAAQISGTVTKTGASWQAVTLTAGLSGTLRVKKIPLNEVELDVQVTATASGSYTCGSLPDSSYYPVKTTYIPLVSSGSVAGFVQIPTSGALTVHVGDTNPAGTETSYPTD